MDYLKMPFSLSTIPRFSLGLSVGWGGCYREIPSGGATGKARD
jgi:hypothetical protein